MRQHKVNDRTYLGFSRFDADAAELVIATFDGDTDLWSMDEDSCCGLPNILQLYLDDYGREPEDIQVYRAYRATKKDILILRSDGYFLNVLTGDDDYVAYNFVTGTQHATKLDSLDAFEFLKKLMADYSNTGMKFTMVTF